MLTVLRRVLSYQMSVGGLAEVAVWLAGTYLTIGLVWSLFHPDDVQRIQTHLEQQLHLPAGTNYQLAALGEASVLWPVMTVLSAGGCSTATEMLTPEVFPRPGVIRLAQPSRQHTFEPVSQPDWARLGAPAGVVGSAWRRQRVSSSNDVRAGG